jgi:hypothetical protein
MAQERVRVQQCATPGEQDEQCHQAEHGQHKMLGLESSARESIRVFWAAAATLHEQRERSSDVAIPRMLGAPHPLGRVGARAHGSGRKGECNRVHAQGGGPRTESARGGWRVALDGVPS